MNLFKGNRLFRMTRFLLLVLIVCLSSVIEAQISVKIVEEGSQEPLIGATILCKNYIGYSDVSGVAIMKESCDTIQISFVGYVTKTVIREDIAKRDNFIVELSQEFYDFDVLTVTASRFEKRLSENSVSVEVLKPEVIENSNSINIEDALDKMPGVQMLDGQANIRGGSGYSYGAGSRVMLLLDDIPALQADTGFPNWGDMPVEAVGQVEIIKGASSALYGSAALNGIINLKRTFAEEAPETKLSASYLEYLSPNREDAKWWDTRRYQLNFNAIHKQKIERLDLIVHGMYNELESYNDSTFSERYRLGTNLRYRISDNWLLGTNILINKDEKSDFFLWSDSRSGVYRPFDGSISRGDNLRYMIDPYIQYVTDGGTKHKLQSRYHYIDNKNNNNQANTTKAKYVEYSISKELSRMNTSITSGIAFQDIGTESQLLGDYNFDSQVLGIYTQLDKKINDKITLSAGSRYEYINQNGPEFYRGDTIPGGNVSDSDLIFRFGVNAQILDYTFLRASYGEGYRYPTLTERYVSTTFASFQIFPNPLIQAERGISYELGVKQGIKFLGFKVFLDFAFFSSRYEDMIEFTFIFEGTDIGFKPFNIGDTRINGFELGLLLNHSFNKRLSADIFGGYTYLDPIYTNFDENPSISESLSTDQNILKYRSRHTYKMDLQFNFFQFAIGGSLRYASHVENVDKAFEEVFGVDNFEIKRFRRMNDSGYHLLDGRISYLFRNNYKIAFLMNNILNQEYSLRPGLLEAPRNVAVRLDLVF